MKANDFIKLLLAILLFVVGYYSCYYYYVVPLEELNEVQNTAIVKAETVMWNNGLFDADGSDDMEDYLQSAATAQRLYDLYY